MGQYEVTEENRARARELVKQMEEERAGRKVAKKLGLTRPDSNRQKRDRTELGRVVKEVSKARRYLASKSLPAAKAMWAEFQKESTTVAQKRGIWEEMNRCSGLVKAAVKGDERVDAALVVDKEGAEALAKAMRESGRRMKDFVVVKGEKKGA